MTLLERLADGLRDQQRVVVFPEGAEARILAAADRLVQARVASVILLGSPAAVEAAGAAAGASLARVEVVDPEGSDRLEAKRGQYLGAVTMWLLVLAALLVTFYGYWQVALAFLAPAVVHTVAKVIWRN